MSSATERAQLLMMKGAISELPPDQQQAVAACADAIRALLKDSGDAGTIALALVAMEVGAAS